MKYIDIKDIRISSRYLSSMPSTEKLTKKINLIKQGNELNVTISRNNYLLDGYITILAYKKLNYTQVPCIIDYDIEYEEEDDGISQEDRLKIYEDAKGFCYICGRWDYRGNMTIDHFVPKSKGGSNDIDNLRCCCKLCNNLKSNFTYSKD